MCIHKPETIKETQYGIWTADFRPNEIHMYNIYVIKYESTCIVYSIETMLWYAIYAEEDLYGMSILSFDNMNSRTVLTRRNMQE